MSPETFAEWLVFLLALAAIVAGLCRLVDWAEDRVERDVARALDEPLDHTRDHHRAYDRGWR